MKKTNSSTEDVRYWNERLAAADEAVAGAFGEDEEYMAEIKSSLTPETVREVFKGRYGRGWQRKLSQTLGIAESTLSGWLRGDDLPTWGKLAIGAVLTREEPPREGPLHAIRDGDSYLLVSVEPKKKEVLARGVKNERYARLFAAAPLIHRALEEATEVISDLHNASLPDDLWSNLLMECGHALDQCAVPDKPKEQNPD